MTDELVSILNRIGYQTARLYNPNLYFLSWLPSPTGGLLFGNQAEARTNLDLVRGIIDQVTGLLPTVRERISAAARTTEDWDTGRQL